MGRKGWLGAMAVLLTCSMACSAGAEDIPPVPPHPEEVYFGSRIQRTMTLLVTSNPQRRRTVKILFYGQSIVAGEWWKIVEQKLREAYPQANLIVENRAIGGHTAPSLVRCAVHDLYPFYPDLVVFHVYGGETTGELERIVSNIRRYTTAEIMMFTHHIAWAKDADEEAIAQRRESDDLSSDATRYLAQKYNCELVEVRKEWDEYLKTYNIPAKDFLSDTVHPNDKGRELLARLILRHFRYTTVFPGGWYDTVRTYEARRPLEEKADEISFTGEPWEATKAGIIGRSTESILQLAFVGNRVDVIAAPISGKLGTATVQIDGKAPSTFSELYAVTRPSPGPKVSWPAIRRVTLGKNPVAEDWTLKITEISEDGKKFAYAVAGSVTGPDGSGTHEKLFISRSGRIIIHPQDFGIASACAYRKTTCPVGYEVTWSVVPLFVDTWQPQPIEDAFLEDCYTLVQGLENKSHVLEVVPNGDGPIAIREIVVYRPPLR